MIKTLFSSNKTFSFFSTILKQFSTITYNTLNQTDVKFFESFLEKNQCIFDTKELDPFNTDWMEKLKGNSKLLLKPKTTEQVSKILKYCNEKKLAVVPQGGNTGLVGGSIPIKDEIIMSLSNMTQNIHFDKGTSILTVDAGFIVENINQYLEKEHCELPFDLGAKGSCQIGGCLATHAGGKYFIKYGPLKGSVTGIEVVLSNGEILNLTSMNRKDNTGIDLKQLFIGSEGTLGVISKCNIVCPKIDNFRQVIFLQVPKYEKILEINEFAKEKFKKNLAAFEFMDGYAFNNVLDQLKYKNPFEQNKLYDPKNFYVLIEVASISSMESTILEFYETLEKINITNCILSQNETQFNEIWKIREDSIVAAQKLGQMLSYDISLSPKEMNNITDTIRKQFSNVGYTIGYGHIGDGNVHINFTFNNANDKNTYEKQINDFLYEQVRKFKGSISAEHGVGYLKKDYLSYTQAENSINYMKEIKKAFDPNHILNPYKVFV